MSKSPIDSSAGYLAEYVFVTDGIRHAQRERHGFLGFSLAAAGVILGILMRSTSPRSPIEACFLVGMVGGAILVSGRMTIRASQEVVRLRSYLQCFVEPRVEGLDYLSRLGFFTRAARGASSGPHGFAFAYLALTVALILAWLAAPVHGDKQWWQTFLISALAATSVVQVGQLYWIGTFGWKTADRAWRDLVDHEQQVTTEESESLASDSQPLS
jgi:hypothetical protein